MSALEELNFMDFVRKYNSLFADYAKRASIEFGVSEASIYRWQDGIVKPHHVFRRRIIAWTVGEFGDRL